MYGLVKAGIIAQTELEEHLCPFEYEPVPITPELFCHNKNLITFILVVNEFGIISQRIEYSQHLINSLQENMK